MRVGVRATICIPTVRRLGFFREALDSAVCQSFEDYEVLVSVNSPEPGYFQQVAAVVEGVQHRHPSLAIRSVRPSHFLHIADHANFMVNESRGEYWCYLGDDDRMEPAFLETLVPFLDSHLVAGFAFCGFHIIDESGTSRRDLATKLARSSHSDRLRSGFFPHRALARLALWNAMWFPCALFRRSVLQAFPFEVGNEAADRDFWLRIADAPVDFGAVYTPTPLISYRLHEDQYTKVLAAPQSDLINALQRSRNVARAEPSAYRQELASAQAKLGKALLDEGDRLGAWRWLLRATRKNPLDRRTYRFIIQAALPSFVLRLLRDARKRGSS